MTHLLFLAPGLSVGAFRVLRAGYRFATQGVLPYRLSPVPVWLLVAGAGAAARFSG